MVIAQTTPTAEGIGGTEPAQSELLMCDETAKVRRSESINILTLATQIAPPRLELVWLGRDEQLVIPFTPDVTQVDVHWGNMPEIKGYCRCNREIEPAAPCILCETGRTIHSKCLLPVYLPLARKIGILMVGREMNPGALLPQLLSVFEEMQDGTPRLVAIRRDDDWKYGVRANPVQPGADIGAAQVAKFNEDVRSGATVIESVVPTYTNNHLRQVPGIRENLKLRGKA